MLWSGHHSLDLVKLSSVCPVSNVLCLFWMSQLHVSIRCRINMNMNAIKCTTSLKGNRARRGLVVTEPGFWSESCWFGSESLQVTTDASLNNNLPNPDFHPSIHRRLLDYTTVSIGTLTNLSLWNTFNKMILYPVSCNTFHLSSVFHNLIHSSPFAWHGLSLLEGSRGVWRLNNFFIIVIHYCKGYAFKSQSLLGRCQLF